MLSFPISGFVFQFEIIVIVYIPVKLMIEIYLHPLQYVTSEHLVVPCVAWHHKGHNTHLLQYCCRNAGIKHRDFKFSVLNLKNS